MINDPDNFMKDTRAKTAVYDIWCFVMTMTIGGKQSKLELWSIEIKGHLGAEDYLLAGTADNK